MELEGSTKLSKHGATMHCSICKSAEHTKRNHSRCVEQNQGVQLPNVQANDAEVDPTILEVLTDVVAASIFILPCYQIHFSAIVGHKS